MCAGCNGTSWACRQLCPHSRYKQPARHSHYTQPAHTRHSHYIYIYFIPGGHAGHDVLIVQPVQLLLERRLITGLSRPAGCPVFLACTASLITCPVFLACTASLITSVGHSHYLSEWEVACQETFSLLQWVNLIT